MKLDRKKMLAAAVVLAVAAAGLVLWARYGRDTGGSANHKERLSATQALLLGTVTDASTMAPLAEAILKIDQQGGPLTVRTDSRGAYRSVVDVSRPIGLTIDAPGHQGVVAFGKLCPGERRDFPVALPPANQEQAPPAPMVLQGNCR